MEEFTVKILPFLLIVGLITSQVVDGSPLHKKNKNGDNNRTLGNKNIIEEDRKQDETGIGRSTFEALYGVYKNPDKDCYKNFFIEGVVEGQGNLPRAQMVKQPPTGLRKQNNDNIRYICQKVGGNTYYATMFDGSLGIPVYSAYTLRKDNIKFDRSSTAYSWEKNHGLQGKKQGRDELYPYMEYQRGHLVPKMTYSSSKDSTKSTYTYTNSVPQRPFLNSGMWSKFEERIRSYGVKCTEQEDGGVLYLLTGISFLHIRNDLKYVLPNIQVLVPQDNNKPGIAIPNSLWTAGCCVSPSGYVGNFAVIGNNVKKDSPYALTKPVRVSYLQKFLKFDLDNKNIPLGSGDAVELFPGRKECSDDGHDEDLQQVDVPKKKIKV